MREKAKVDFDGKRKHLTGFEVGANVYCQDFKTKRWNRKGTITQTTKRKRTYQVEIDGRKFWRNGKFLRKDPGDPDGLKETEDPVADPPKGPETKGLPRVYQGSTKGLPRIETPRRHQRFHNFAGVQEHEREHESHSVLISTNYRLLRPVCNLL